LNRDELEKVVLDLILNECAAYGKGDEDTIHRSHIDLVRLARVEEARPTAGVKPQKVLQIFSSQGGSSSNESSGLSSLNRDAASNAIINTQWHGTVVIHFFNQAAAQYIASHINGLNSNVQGYEVNISARLLSSGPSGYERRTSWESFFFPNANGATDGSNQRPQSFVPFHASLPPPIQFAALPAGHRPDTLVLKYIPRSWVDGRSILDALGVSADEVNHSHRLRFPGSMEEDEIGSLSDADESEHEDDEEIAGVRLGRSAGPSHRRLMRLIKRQFELLLKPAAKLANLATQTIHIKRWEYKVMEETTRIGMGGAKKRKSTSQMNGETQDSGEDIPDELLLFPLLNPQSDLHQHHPYDSDTAAANGHNDSHISSPSSSHSFLPLCEVYLMLDDYPSVLAAFDFLHNKRLCNRLDRANASASATSSIAGSVDEKSEGGRVIDFDVDVDRDGYLRFERIEHRRQVILDQYEKMKAALQLAAHQARKQKEEEARLERERMLREEEEEMERRREEERARLRAKLLEEERMHAERLAKQREEDEARRQAAAAEERERREQERARQAARRAEQHKEEETVRLQLEQRMESEDVAFTTQEREAKLRRLALESMRSKVKTEPPSPQPSTAAAPSIIDLSTADPDASTMKVEAWDPDRIMPLTSPAIHILDSWFRAHSDRPFPTDSTCVELARQSNIAAAQVREWFVWARKNKWKVDNGRDEDENMPTLISAKQETENSIAAAMKQHEQEQQQASISITLKSRPKFHADEDAAREGFVRVEAASTSPLRLTPSTASPPIPATASSSTSNDQQAAKVPDHVAAAIAALESRLSGHGGGGAAAANNIPRPAASVPASHAVHPSRAAQPSSMQPAQPAAASTAMTEEQRAFAEKYSKELAAFAARSIIDNKPIKRARSKSRSRSRSGSRGRDKRRSSHKRHGKDKDAPPAGMLPLFPGMMPFPPFGFPPAAFGFPPGATMSVDTRGQAPPLIAPSSMNVGESSKGQRGKRRKPTQSDNKFAASASAAAAAPPLLPIPFPPMFAFLPPDMQAAMMHHDGAADEQNDRHANHPRSRRGGRKRKGQERPDEDEGVHRVDESTRWRASES